MNGIVGVGIFLAPPEVAAAIPGVAGTWLYLAVGVSMLPVAITFARLGSTFQEDGGPYVYAREAFGQHLAFGIGFASYVSAFLSTATVIVGLVQSLSGEGTGPRVQAIWAAVVTLGLTIVLSAGLRLSAWVWSIVTVAKLVPLLALIAFGAIALGSLPRGGVTPTPQRGATCLSASLTILFALQGFEIVSLPAGQVRSARRVVPRATVGSLLAAVVLYAAIHFICAVALPNLASEQRPLVAAGQVVGGAPLASLVRCGMTLSTLGIAIGMMAMTPRYLSALGTSQHFGTWLSRLSSRSVPVPSFGITALLVSVCAALAVTEGSIGHLFALSSVAVILQYLVTSAALLVLATRKRYGLRPRDAWPVPLSWASCLILLSGATALEFALVSSVIAVGFCLRAIRRKFLLPEATD